MDIPAMLFTCLICDAILPNSPRCSLANDGLIFYPECQSCPTYGYYNREDRRQLLQETIENQSSKDKENDLKPIIRI